MDTTTSRPLACTALHEAINRGGDAGILFIAAAGNSGTNNDVTPSYPSNYQCTNQATLTGFIPRDWDCVVAVAAIDSVGGLASFSQYGATTVDLGAPGVGIWSTLPNNTYGSYSGTSMATPHVSGAAALCASIGNLEGKALRDALLDSVAPTDSLLVTTVTGGRLDVSSFPTRCTGAPSPLAIATRSPLPPGEVGVEYNETLSATGGTIPYSWTATDLPGWLSISSDGTITGTPTSTEVGTTTFGVTVSDAAGASESATLTLNVLPASKTTATTFSEVSPTIGTRMSTIDLTATLQTAGEDVQPVSGVEVTFTFNGKTYLDTTDDAGVASVTVSTPAAPGSVAASVSFAGDDLYEAASAEWTISITK